MRFKALDELGIADSNIIYANDINKVFYASENLEAMIYHPAFVKSDFLFKVLSLYKNKDAESLYVKISNKIIDYDSKEYVLTTLNLIKNFNINKEMK